MNDISGPEVLIRAEKLRFSYGEKVILDNISFELKRGEILGVIGESGSGKSSLMHLLAGLRSAQEGRLTFREEEIPGPGKTLVPGHAQIKLVSQDFDLMPYLPVENNILRHSLAESETGRKKLLRHFRKKLRLGQIGKNRAMDISGGQKQRTALAAALAARPAVLLLDEPFSNLDYPLKKALISLLKEEWKTEAMVIATHEPADMLSLADRILVIRKGKIIQEGPSGEVYHRPRSEYAARLLGNVNVLEPGEAAVFGIGTPRKVFLRPEHFCFAGKGTEGEVLSCILAGSLYEVSVFCREIGRPLLVSSLFPLSGKVHVQVRSGKSPGKMTGSVEL